MTRRIGLANVVMAGLLVSILQCKQAPEKAADTTPSTSDTAQDKPTEFEPVNTERPVSTEPLEDTYWKLTLLGDTPVIEAPRQREPHLIFNSQNRRLGGSGGCNYLGGSYELKGDRLSLDSITTTLMACAEGMETEKDFLEALQEVSGWRITGRQLELLKESGNLIARFEARPPE